MGHVCGCGKGYASKFDNVCCFCREKQYSRRETKAVGVRIRGEGMSIEQKILLRKEGRWETV